MNRKILHIGVVVHDLEAAIAVWEKNFGFKERHRVDVAEEGIRTAMLSPTGALDEMAVELLEPMDKNDMGNPVARRLARSGEGFYHLAMTVDDLDSAGRALGARGITVIERPPATLGSAFPGVIAHDSCRQIVHPKFSNGILIELLQSQAQSART